MELALNLVWLVVAGAGLALVPKRSRLVWYALLCAAALLFPIISVSDDMHDDWALNDAVAAIAVTIVLAVAFVVVAHLRFFPPAVYAVHVATLSDPRSPPAR